MTKNSIIVLVFLIILGNIYSENRNVDKMLKFANELKNKGEYYRAITEYFRVNSYYPNNKYYVKNLNKIAECYKKAKHYKEAINIYNKVLNLDNDNYKWESVYDIAKTYNKINYFYESNDFIDNYLHKFKKEKNDKLLMLSINNYFNLANFNKVRERIPNISLKNSEKKQRIKKILKDYTPLDYKNKTVGGFLSLFFPGGGYFYTKKYETGIAAMTLNGLLGWATYNSFRNDKTSQGITFGVLFTSFHLGSFYGSLQAVDSYNKKLKFELVKKVEFLK